MAKAVPLPGSGLTECVPMAVPGTYEILGSDMQILNLATSGSSVISVQPGAMNYMSPNMKMEVNCNSCYQRCFSGESCILATYKNTDGNPGFLGVTPKIPAKVVPLDVKDGQMTWRVKSGGWFASIDQVVLDFDTDCNPATCCCGGQGCFRQTLKGNGTAFLAAMGTIMTKELAAGEVMVLDTNSLVAWQDTIKLDIKMTGGFCTCCCGGEGLFNTTVEGPGVVYIQSMSVEKFKAALRVAAAKGGGGKGGGAPLVGEEMAR